MSATEAATDPKPRPAGRLLALVRALFDYGKQLAATLRDNPHPFSPADIALILARITRGLLRAEALEAKIIRDTAHLDAEPTPRRAPSHRTSPRAQAATPGPADAKDASPDLVPGLDPAISLPTAEQIAAEVRRRPIGSVIADICRDLGIMPNHPLWPELRDLITRYGGNLVRLVNDIFDRTLGPIPSTRSPSPARALVPQSPPPSSTGPPS